MTRASSGTWSDLAFIESKRWQPTFGRMPVLHEGGDGRFGRSDPSSAAEVDRTL